MSSIKLIIVNCNSEKWIENCLNSIKKANFIDETIVVDNASTDRSVDLILQFYSEVELIKLNKNIGFGKANNIGIRKAYDSGADFVFLMNQDVYIEPNTIEKLIELSKIHSEFGILSPIHLNGKGTALDYNFSNYIAPNLCRDLYSDIFLNKFNQEIYELPFVNAAAWLITRHCIEIVGGFNPSFFHYGEDNNYCQRVLFHNFKIGIVPHLSIYHDRENRLNNTYFEDKMLIEERRVIDVLSNPLNSYTIRKLYFKSFKSMIKSFITGRFKLVKVNYHKIKLYNSINMKIIEQNKIQSLIKGKNFL